MTITKKTPSKVRLQFLLGGLRYIKIDLFEKHVAPESCIGWVHEPIHSNNCSSNVHYTYWWGVKRAINAQQIGHGRWHMIIKWALGEERSHQEEWGGWWAKISYTSRLGSTVSVSSLLRLEQKQNNESMFGWWLVGGLTYRQTNTSWRGWIKIMAYWLVHCPQCRPTSAAELKSALSAGETGRRSSAG